MRGALAKVAIGLSFIFIIMDLQKLLSFPFPIRSKTNHSTPELPPGPTKLPLIGNMHELIGSLPHRRLRDLAKEYGSIMHLQLGEVTNIIISSPEAAKQVMKTHDCIFAQRPFVSGASVVSYDYSDIAFGPYSDSWRQLRKISVLEVLSAKRVQSFRSIREGEVSKLISKISSSSGKPFNLSKHLFALTYDIAALASFGTKCKDKDEFIPLVEEIIEAMSGFSLADIFPSIKFLHLISGIKSKLVRLQKEVDRIIQNIIDDHRERKKTGMKADDKGREDDLVDVLLRIQEEGDLEFPLTTVQMKAVILDVFVAGSETSSTTTEWAMSELVRHPRVMEKAQAEVRKVVGKKGNVDETDLHELKYLKAVIKETLRLRPPGPLLLPRECRERCEIDGFEIPAKSKVIVNAWAIARDPNYWNEPETFYPERFLDSTIDYKGNNFEYIPFGAGRRMCPGIVFGIANVELALAQLLYHFDWKLPNGSNPESLDMTEHFGAGVRRKHELVLVPIPYTAA